jgi:hypothetical protein
MELKYLSFLEEYKDVTGFTEGISIEEIAHIENMFHVKLPVAYKEYLAFFGKESGNLLGSYYTEYSFLIENKEDAFYALNFDDRKSSKDKPEFKDSYFFFGQWQGGVFFFFDCEETVDNPTIYIFEDSLKIHKYHECFSDFILYEGLKPLLTHFTPRISKI